MDDTEQRELGGEPETLGTTAAPVDQLFNIFEHYYSTRTADAHRAVMMENGAGVLLWRLRYPIASHSEVVARFTVRMERLAMIDTPTPKILSFGVDPSGVAFVATEFIKGSSLFESPPSLKAQQRLFLEILRGVTAFHDQGIILGDICEHSFLMQPGGQMLVQGLLGPFEVEATQTSLLPSAETLQYLSPEQRSGSGVVPASDVYSLGTYGYRLFTGRYMFGDKPPPVGMDEAGVACPAPSSLQMEIPIWIDDILGCCVQVKPEDRYESARLLFADFQQALSSGQAKQSGGRWSSRTLIVKPDTVRAVRRSVDPRSVVEQSGEPIQPGAKEQDERSGPSLGLLLLLPLVLIGGLAAAGIFLFVDSTITPQTEFEQDMALLKEGAPPELQASMDEMVAPNVPLARRKEALNKIAESDDPVAYAVLVSVVKTAPGALKNAGQQVIVNRIKRQGLPRSAKTIAQWFEALTSLGHDPSMAAAYLPLLNACNPIFPLDRRRFALRRAYDYEPLMSLQLAAALALDDPEPYNFTPVLRQLLSAQLGRDDFDKRSLGALILSHTMLSHIFREDLDKMIESFANEDLAWVLLELARTNNPMIYTIAEETLERKVVPRYQAIFLKALTNVDRYDLPQAVKISLVRGLRGEITESDVLAFGRWMSLESESVLLAICAIVNDESVGMSAFDTLAASGVHKEPAGTFFEIIKNNYWDHRKKLVKSIGILGHADIATAEQIQYSYDVLIPYIGIETMFKSVIAAKHQDDDYRLIYLALDRFLNAAPTKHLLKLLNHPSKRIRILAVTGLKENNELEILQRILRAFKREKDEEVREIYNKYHWVTVQEPTAPDPAKKQPAPVPTEPVS